MKMSGRQRTNYLLAAGAVAAVVLGVVVFTSMSRRSKASPSSPGEESTPEASPERRSGEKKKKKKKRSGKKAAQAKAQEKADEAPKEKADEAPKVAEAPAEVPSEETKEAKEAKEAINRFASEGVAHYKKGRYPEAIESFNEAFELSKTTYGLGSPSTLRVLNNRSSVLEKMENWTDCADDCTLILEADPRKLKARARRCRVLSKLGRTWDSFVDATALITVCKVEMQSKHMSGMPLTENDECIKVAKQTEEFLAAKAPGRDKNLMEDVYQMIMEELQEAKAEHMKAHPRFPSEYDIGMIVPSYDYYVALEAGADSAPTVEDSVKAFEDAEGEEKLALAVRALEATIAHREYRVFKDLAFKVDELIGSTEEIALDVTGESGADLTVQADFVEAAQRVVDVLPQGLADVDKARLLLFVGVKRHMAEQREGAYAAYAGALAVMRNGTEYGDDVPLGSARAFEICILVHMADLFVDQKRKEPAAQLLELCVSMDPDCANAYVHRAHLRAHLKRDAEGALADLTRALELDGDCVLALLRTVHIHLEKARGQEADPERKHEQLNKAHDLLNSAVLKLQENPALSLTWRSPVYTTKGELALVEMELGRSDTNLKAEKHFRNAIKASADNYRAQTYLGMILMSSEKTEEGQACFVKALEDNPNYGMAMTQRGIYEIHHANTEEKMTAAIDTFRTAALVSETDEDLHEAANFYTTFRAQAAAWAMLGVSPAMMAGGAPMGAV